MTKPGRALSSLLRAASIRPLDPLGVDPVIRGAALDSRRVEPGDVFFAISGFHSDGHAHVAEAVERGASAVVATSARPAGVPTEVGWVRVEDTRLASGLLSRECYDRPDEALAIVGVTGTNGKTTVTYLVESIGRAAGRRVGRIGTTGSACDGVDRPLARTTPEAPDLYRLLAEMREAGLDLVAMEVSSHALSLSRVAGARFAVAAFLNLSSDHLDFHGDEASYFAAKARLFDTLGSDHWAVLPADSAHGNELIARTKARTKARTLTFGRSPVSGIRLTEERSGLEGSSAILETPSGRLPVRTFLLGKWNLDNVAAAAACALALGLPPESIPAGVLALEGVPGRMERIDCGQPFTVIVDYAHTAAALEAVLSWTRSTCGRRVVVVFGCGGNRDTGKRPLMGRAAAMHADAIFLTSDNPRDEDPESILSQVAQGVASVAGGSERCTLLADREQAIRAALAEARPGDLVVIAGRGHEPVQMLAGKERPLDDRTVARKALRDLRWNGGRRAGD